MHFFLHAQWLPNGTFLMLHVTKPEMYTSFMVMTFPSDVIVNFPYESFLAPKQTSPLFSLIQVTPIHWEKILETFVIADNCFLSLKHNGNTITATVLACSSGVKLRPNDRNMPTQHIAKLLSATCWVRLATLLQFVSTCWVLLAQVWRWSNLSQQHPTCRNKLQHGGQTYSTCCA